MKIKNMGIAVATIFCLASFATTALAQLSVSITVKNPDPYSGNQSWFIYEKKAGDVVEDTASIKNYGSEPMHIHICAIDGTTNTSGSFVLRFDYEKQAGIGAWTTVPKSDMIIKPGERIDIPFKIAIPKNAQPGQYLGGIIVESEETHLMHNVSTANSTMESKPNTSYGKAVVATRIGARIYITIPGETEEKVSVDKFEFIPVINNKSFFRFKITNKGNVAFAPTASIKIFDQLGNLYDKIEKPLGTSAPNTTIEPIILWDKRPILGQFTASADITFKRIFEPVGELHGAPITFNTSTKFLILPWVSFILFFFMFMGVSAYGIHKWSQIKTIVKTSRKYQVTSNDDLMSIAEETKTPWQLIAKINHLKAPYSIKPGQIIIIPNIQKNK